MEVVSRNKAIPHDARLKDHMINKLKVTMVIATLLTEKLSFDFALRLNIAAYLMTPEADRLMDCEKMTMTQDKIDEARVAVMPVLEKLDEIQKLPKGSKERGADIQVRDMFLDAIKATPKRDEATAMSNTMKHALNSSGSITNMPSQTQLASIERIVVAIGPASDVDTLQRGITDTAVDHTTVFTTSAPSTTNTDPTLSQSSLFHSPRPLNYFATPPPPPTTPTLRSRLARLRIRDRSDRTRQTALHRRLLSLGQCIRASGEQMRAASVVIDEAGQAMRGATATSEEIEQNALRGWRVATRALEGFERIGGEVVSAIEREGAVVPATER